MQAFRPARQRVIVDSDRNSLPDYVSVYEADIPTPAPAPTAPLPPLPPSLPAASNLSSHPSPPVSPSAMAAPPQLHSQTTGSSIQGTKLLKVNYEQVSVVILGSERFEDVEQASREMFQIPDTTPIYISADVPSFNNERITVHRAVWPVISNDITVIWITTSLRPSPSGSILEPPSALRHLLRTPPPLALQATRAGSPTPETRTVHITVRNPTYSRGNNTFDVPIPIGATIGELMGAIKLHTPRRWSSQEAVLRLPKSMMALATEDSYDIEYHEMPRETTNRV
ncbi:hypothetical protein M408DRAFT_328639 [Serendipita vermifera MAFF 305830]|uniref:Uncharacterized protein n=1 Tax=Serendipita vermifera MAFF 305830 TaxID=933852 RepID=A0A0C3BEE8_SERVB|nr:hypothetical protein M408DRAFT_328639 [Serendipita vermifera MAFF 305830]